MSRQRIWVTLAVVSVLLFGALKLVGPVKPPPGVILHDLENVRQLATAFNEAKGIPRLVLVLSPT